MRVQKTRSAELDLDFLQEALGSQRGGQFRTEHLDGDLAVVPEVVGKIDRGHPARAELAIKAVAIAQRAPKVVDWLRHRTAPPAGSSALIVWCDVGPTV